MVNQISQIEPQRVRDIEKGLQGYLDDPNKNRVQQIGIQMQNTQIQQVNSNNTQLNTLIPQIHQIPLNQQQLYYSNFNQNYQFNHQHQMNQFNYQHQINQFQSFQNFQNINISWNTNYCGNQNNFNYITKFLNKCKFKQTIIIPMFQTIIITQIIFQSTKR